MGEEQRNLFIALGLILAIMLGYEFFFLRPAQEAREAERQAALEAAGELAEADPDLQLPDAPAGPVYETRDEALDGVERIEIEGPAVLGSLSLAGARFDDLRLRRHTVSVDDDTPIALLNPIGTERTFYARDGWQSATPGFADLPGNSAEWTLVSGDRLTPDTPVVLAYETASGLRFERTVSLDDNYMFTIADTVTNNSGRPVDLARYGLVRHEGVPDDLVNNIAVFEGTLAVVNGALTRTKFQRLAKGEGEEEISGTGGWVGITQRYWMAAAIPDQDVAFTANFRIRERGAVDAYEATYIEATRELAPGESLASTAYIFAGAKELDVLDAVEDDYGIARFDMAINWGWLWFLTRPFVWLLHMLEGVTGHFGLAILALTLLIKLVMFPLANRAYASMAKMKAVQPKMQEIKERYAADTQKQQQALMELYRKEKINPLAGLPAHPAANPDLLRPLPDPVQRHRDAPRALLRLDPRPLRAGPDQCVEPVRPDPLRPVQHLADRRRARHRRLADHHGADHGRPAGAQPAAAGSDAGAHLRHAAHRLHLRAGAVRGRPGDLLGLEQFPLGAAAIHHHAAPRERDPARQADCPPPPGRQWRGRRVLTGHDDLDLAAGRRLFSRPCTFIMGAVSLDQLPEPDRIEIAFAGRSNVGKSSLINAVTRQNNLARASGEPRPHARAQLLQCRRLGSAHRRPARLRLCQGAQTGGGEMDPAHPRLPARPGSISSASTCWSTAATGSSRWTRRSWTCSTRRR